MIHGIAGLANAWSNCWPMILLGGANDSYQNGQGAFQEAPQIESARPYVKYAARPDRLERIPFYVEQAVRTSATRQAGLLAVATRVSIIGLATAMGLRQMGLANEIINLAFGLLLGAIAVASALAFGLGARDVAGRTVEDWAKTFRSE